MENDLVRQVVAKAVQEAYAAWAAKHPSLAAVIDRITVTQRVAESLRDSDACRRAIASYYRSRSELELFSELLDIAGPIVSALLSS